MILNDVLLILRFSSFVWNNSSRGPPRDLRQGLRVPIFDVALPGRHPVPRREIHENLNCISLFDKQNYGAQKKKRRRKTRHPAPQTLAIETGAFRDAFGRENKRKCFENGLKCLKVSEKDSSETCFELLEAGPMAWLRQGCQGAAPRQRCVPREADPWDGKDWKRFKFLRKRS